MFTGPKNDKGTLILVCSALILILGLGILPETQSFGQIFNGISFLKGKSLGDLARKKIANLHSLRNQLENKGPTTNKFLSPTAQTFKLEKSTERSSVSYNTFKNETIKSKGNKLNKKSPIEERISLFPSMWDSLRSVFSMKKTRDGFLARILPNSQALLKLIKMRNDMDPNLRDYLTSKYNNLLTKLEPYSNGIGIPSFVVNSMKISQSQDLHWYTIQKLLETTSVTDLIQSLPDFSSSSSPTFDNSLTYESIQSRVDDELVSDQEPDATVKGHKKKYASYGSIPLRLGGRLNRPTKGDLASVAASSSTNILGPDRTGYEYSSYADQYGLYGHDSYDTYGKGHDDYSATHKGSGYGHSSGGHGGGGHKGGGYGGTGKGHGGGSSSYGHSTHYSPKSYGGNDGGYEHSASGWGWSSYGGGGGHGGGGYGGGHMSGFLDPFSILGTLAFLTYLGLLFQRSVAPTMPVNTSGRAFPHNVDPLFGRKNPVELTLLNFDTESPEKALKQHDRRIRSLENLFQDEDMMTTGTLEDTWKEINEIIQIHDLDCRQMKLCYLVQDIGQTHLLSIFKEALEKWEEDRKYLNGLYNQTDTEGITCNSELSLDCQNSVPDYKIDPVIFKL